MELIKTEFKDRVAHITFDDGKGNGLNPASLEALDMAFARVERDASAVVLRGREKVFCGGLDLPSLVGLDHASLSRFLDIFNGVHDRLLAYPLPIITVVKGSAVAGGAILMCAGDNRLATPNGKIGINEGWLGVNIPTSALELVRQALGSRGASQAAQSAKLYEGDERRTVGFATEIVPADRIDARADEIGEACCVNDREAVRVLRAQLRWPAMQRVASNSERDSTRFLELWFRPETQARLSSVVDRLGARRP